MNKLNFRNDHSPKQMPVWIANFQAWVDGLIIVLQNTRITH